MAAARQLLLRPVSADIPARTAVASRIAVATAALNFPCAHRRRVRLHEFCGRRTPSQRLIAATGGATGGEEGVLLGTLKLPTDTDLQRFETLLFQWANSLFQGANVPLPAPLKVDRVKGGARLGFSRSNEDDGSSMDVPVYIDCLVFPAADADSPGVPVFRAIRNGPLKGEPAPGEPAIMRSLLQALRTSVEIARI